MPASFDALRAAIHHDFETLSPHLQRLARVALDDPNAVALTTVANLAARAAVQPSSVIRFAKAFGYDGFRDMQRVFRVRLIEGATGARERILARSAQAEPAPDGLERLAEFVDANRASLETLRDDVDPARFRGAIELLARARDIYVIGLRRAFPVAAYLFYGLVRSEFRCHLLDVVGGMVPQQAAAIGQDDLLVAISFAEYAPLTVDVIQEAFIRGVPTLTITDSPLSPLARHGTVSFVLSDAGVHLFRPLAGPMCLVQSLIVAATEARRALPTDRRAGSSG